MDYLSLFSGIEAASVAWAPLGWRPLAFAEVDAFPSAVLRERFPSVPNLGDVTKVNWRGFAKEFGRPDVLVGGSPCQSFSIAGTRTGLGGASGLMWEYVRAVREVRPRWLLWENVPGALSSTHGEDFGCLLRSLDALGYGLAWRVLDAQFFGVAQRRERVFLVGRLGDPGGPCQVLFEPDCLSWNPPQGREKRKELAAAAGRRPACAGFKYSAGSGANGVGHEEESCNTFTADWHAPAVYPVQTNYGSDLAGTLTARGDSSAGPMRGQNVICMTDTQTNSSVSDDGTVGTITSHSSKDAPAVAFFAVRMREGKAGGGKGPLVQDDVSGTIATGNDQTIFSFAQNTRDEVRVQGDGTLSGALSASPGMKQTTYVCMADDNANAAVDVECCGTLKCGGSAPQVARRMSVRRLMPRECERLQGFPDDWTLIPWKGRPAEECPDGPRYKAIGNSMAVPVMRWLGERIAVADQIPPEEVEW
jgi:DNA (cytosine-5)-methyltransferase 1